MKKVLVGAMALLTLAACSNEEVLQKNEVNQEIGFTAVTGKALTRAYDGFCNKVTPPTFVVSALYTEDGSTYKQYFLNDTYKKASEGEDVKSYISVGSERYWPDLGTDTDSKKMKFFAAYNANPAWVTDGADAYKAMTVSFTVAPTVADQKDFIYAVADVEKKPEAAQSLYFRHALSQIEFRAQNKNEKIYVEIDGVKVCNVASSGTFTMKDKTTNNFENHSTGTLPDGGFGPTTADTDSRDGRGTWSDFGTKTSYETTFAAVALSGDVKNLTPENDKEYTSKSMYLIPQALTAWNTTSGPATATGQTGSYFLVKALIYNMAGSTVNKTTDVVLWGDKTSSSWESKYIAIPVPASTTWEDGKRYVYTFIFSTGGNGGFDPGDNDPVLTPITLDVKVDDFEDETGKDVPMAKE